MYEFLTIGVLVSLQAVETALRVHLNSGQQFKQLIDRAQREGLIDDEAQKRLHAGREIRNLFSHPNQQSVWPFGIASSAIAASHEIVGRLFADE